MYALKNNGLLYGRLRLKTLAGIIFVKKMLKNVGSKL